MPNCFRKFPPKFVWQPTISGGHFNYFRFFLLPESRLPSSALLLVHWVRKASFSFRYISCFFIIFSNGPFIRFNGVFISCATLVKNSILALYNSFVWLFPGFNFSRVFIFNFLVIVPTAYIRTSLYGNRFDFIWRFQEHEVDQ